MGRGFFFAILASILSAAGWFVLTTRPMRIVTEPVAERMELSGPWPRLRIGDRYLLRSGEHVVEAWREGYRPLRETLTIDGGTGAEIVLALEELPGVVTLRASGGDDPAAPLDGVEVFIDGHGCGEAPLEEIELERGTHVVRLRRERYRELEAELEVEGFRAPAGARAGAAARLGRRRDHEHAGGDAARRRQRGRDDAVPDRAALGSPRASSSGRSDTGPGRSASRSWRSSRCR